MLSPKISKLRRNSQSYQLLKYLALGTGILTLSIITPMSGALIIKSLIKSYFRKKRFEKQRFLRDIKNLQKRELIDYKELDKGIIEIKITKQGQLKMLNYKFEEIKLKPMKKWDRRWRLILFDIPHFQKRSRDLLRENLQNMNFHRLQKSVYLTPYPCEDEIDFISSILNIRKDVLVLYVSNFEGEEKLKYYFNIK